MDAFRAKPFSLLEYPRNSAFGPETHVLHFSHKEGLRNAPKHSQISFFV
jgi:hypothetical protein